ncbi:MAG TPA: beta-Ala-His dipeptidase [Chthonomonadaceae bacterium]|nr:beta-Ala-His dipeptidase [Chthonomonadaceae bacterium]
MDRDAVLLLRYFEELCRIPRGSGNEAGVRESLRAFADEHGFAFAEDAAGNCVASVPGRGAGEGAPGVIIQAHMDMVCVKDLEHAAHDFTRDPIRTRVERRTESGREREFVMATGTTLGADNGIGLVAAQAVAVDSGITDCPPLELLFTVEEETGLTGARKMDPDLLRADLLINLDTEEIGEICVSCAGGRDLMAEWKAERSSPAHGEFPVRLSLTGLPGGHSGVQIHERRGNAITMLIGAARFTTGFESSARLASFSGGTARNVIPGNAELVVWVDAAFAERLRQRFTDPAVRAGIASVVRTDEPGRIALGIERVAEGAAPLPISAAQSHRILSAIGALPCGVETWSEVVEGLVETSNNVAVIGGAQEAFTLQCATRSSAEGAIEALQESMRARLERSGASVAFGDGYPGWPADPENQLLRQAERTFERVLGAPPKVMAVHAGLECGVLKGKRPSLQMISFGPDIFGAHTVNERVALDTIAPFYACLTGLLRDLCQPEAVAT